MIALVTAAWIFSENLFGGGQKLIKNTMFKIAKKESIIFLPAIKEIGLVDDLNTVEEKLGKNNILIPEKIIKRSNYSTSYDEMLRIYKDEIMRNDVKIIFDPLPTVDIFFRKKSDKFKLIKNGVSPFINVCNDVVSFDAYCLSKMTNKKLVILYQWGHVRKIESALKYYIYGLKYRFKDSLELLKLRYKYVSAIKLDKILRTAKILSVSEGVLEEIPIDKKEYNVRILEHAIPIEEDLTKYRSKFKENYVVFFAKLSETKGVTEIPFIMKYIISQIKDTKLYIFGKFFDRGYEQYIKNLIKKLNLENNIKFLGFLKDEDKYKIVSKAKLVIYPTHEDSYSYVILESIAVGTPVVSYALPGPYSVYKRLPAVRFVKEFNIKGIADEAVRILKMKDEDYFNLVYNEKVNEFIKKRLGWDKIAEEIYSALQTD